MSLQDIRHDISNILSGVYSLGGRPDTAIIESLIRGRPDMLKYSFEGLSDIRVIVFRGFPVMAMMRCPTHQSDGKANLHQGAVGVGLDICTGRAIRAVQRNVLVDRHPDTGVDFSDLAIPDWDEILMLAAKCYDMTGLGYIGCDFVLDETRGPMILELNARPGLAVQIANGIGLKTRLEAIEALEHFDLHAKERVALIRDKFAATPTPPGAAAPPPPPALPASLRAGPRRSVVVALWLMWPGGAAGSAQRAAITSARWGAIPGAWATRVISALPSTQPRAATSPITWRNSIRLAA